MTVFDVLDQYGVWKLAAFVFALATFLLLHLLRLPFVAVARGLWLVQSGLDRRITTAAAVGGSEGRKSADE